MPDWAKRKPAKPEYLRTPHKAGKAWWYEDKRGIGIYDNPTGHVRIMTKSNILSCPRPRSRGYQEGVTRRKSPPLRVQERPACPPSEDAPGPVGITSADRAPAPRPGSSASASRASKRALRPSSRAPKIAALEPAPRKVRAPDGIWKPAFLEALARSGKVTASARSAGVDASTVYEARRHDPAFEAAFEEARAVAGFRLLDEALRRGVTGYLEPVYQRGEKVGSIRRYSDALLIRLLEANYPERFRRALLGLPTPSVGSVEVKGAIVIREVIGGEEGGPDA